MPPQDWFQHRLKDAPREKLAALEEAVDLKEEHLLAGGEAFFHMKHNAAVERLIAAAEARAAASSGLNLSAAKSLCEQARLAVAGQLGMVSAGRSTPENWGVLSAHHVLSFFEDPAAERQLMEGLNSPGEFLWRFDYERFLAKYISARGMLPEFMPEESDPVIALHAALLAAAQSEEPHLINAHTGEAISFREFAKNPRHRSLSECSADEIRRSIANAREIHGALAGMPDQVFHNKLARRRMAEYTQRLEPEKSEMRLGAPQSDIRELHNFDRLYTRAENEMTLRTFPVERRLALAAVLKRSEQGLAGAERVSQAVSNIRAQMREAKTRCRGLEENRAPTPIIEAEKKHIEKHEYQLWAIHQNKRWLEKFLDG